MRALAGSEEAADIRGQGSRCAVGDSTRTLAGLRPSVLWRCYLRRDKPMHARQAFCATTV
jgi:hypothetical protein